MSTACHSRDLGPFAASVRVRALGAAALSVALGLGLAASAARVGAGIESLGAGQRAHDGDAALPGHQSNAEASADAGPRSDDQLTTGSADALAAGSSEATLRSALAAAALPPAPLEAFTPTPAPLRCEPPEPTGRWRGRASDDQWARGLYPAKERYPAGWLALTFDDGPHRSHTPLVLDLLAEHELPATFFLTGFAIRASTYHLVRRMVDEGHTVANHGWRHDIGMTRKQGSVEALERYLEAELELTQVRVDLAMMAQSAEDFAAMDQQVFGKLRRWHSRERQLAAMPGLRERHRQLLQEHGFSEQARPVVLRWARPPGGIPYMGRRTHQEREAFARVMDRMGLLLAMWSGGTGDSDPHLEPHERMDPARISRTARKAAARGGVYVAHDRIALRGLRAMVEALATSEATMVSLDQLERAKHEARGWCSGAAAPPRLAQASAPVPTR